MTPGEAIHIQQLHLDGDPKLVDIKLRKAMYLSTEALKQILQIRAYAKKLYLPLLPGETEEGK